MKKELVNKFITHGRWSCSNTELLSLALHDVTGSYETALKILEDNAGSIAKVSVPDLMKYKGISQSKAVRIAAMCELSTRKISADTTRLRNSQDAYDQMQFLKDLSYEEFWVILLNKANRILNKFRISEGGVSGTIVDPKKIFKIALDNHASCLILAHNHPSGVCNPSEADRKITQKVVSAGMVLEIKVLDHIIIGNNFYFSFADEGIINENS